jgi:HlyD family secretion protein
MKRLLIVLGVIVLLIAGWSGYRAYTAQRAAGEATSQDAANAQVAATPEDVIWASGKLVPVQWAGLSPATSGTVRAVYVNEGDQVESGRVLIELDNAVLQSQVQVAEASVTEAEAARDKLLAGATASQVAAARAEVAAVQAGLAQAQAGLAQAEEAATAAAAQVAIARAQYAELASRPTAAELQTAVQEVELARLALEHAQAAYDLVRGDPHIGALPESLALQQATANLNAAKAAYNVLAQGATPQQLAAAKAQVDAAQAQTEVAKAGIPQAESNLRAAQAAIDRAQATLDGLLAGATPEDRAMAEARVAAAKAALAVAQAQLHETQVSAPFAGQIGNLLTRPGELATPGQPLLMLGDTSQMRVETTDLREADVTRLKTGMPVEITFDALPGRTFQGKVLHIAPMSNAEKGSTNYTVIITAADLDPSLRWGMTAFVNIQKQ